MKAGLKFSSSAVFALALGVVFLIALGSFPRSQNLPLPAANLQISTQQFGRYVDAWSEPEGFFDSDNFISNETSYLHVMNELQDRVPSRGVYIGVGPDQNFSYIAQTKPQLAVIVDIRRQNMLQHLLYKALFELAGSRTEYVSLLFSREVPKLKQSPSLEEILAAVHQAPTSDDLFRANLSRVAAAIDGYGLKLSTDDVSKIEYVYRTFWQANLDLQFSTIGRASFVRYPTYQELLLETDRDGQRRNFLASEDTFQWLKKFEADNLLIPIVGDFAGSHAFNAVGAFISENALQVTTFYTSNVEFYLFGTSNWPSYVDNIRALPMTPDAVFIRAYFTSPGRTHPLNMAGHRSTSMVQSVRRFLSDYDYGDFGTYWDVVRRLY